METLIEKWIRETVTEFNLAKTNQNYFKMREMNTLRIALITMKDNLLKSRIS
jgi:hypothetical protein